MRRESVFFNRHREQPHHAADEGRHLPGLPAALGQANGLIFDAEGRLYACEGGDKRVTRTELDGTITVLAKDFEGNGLQWSERPRPRCGRFGLFHGSALRPAGGHGDSRAEGKPVEGVYRIAPDGKVTRITTHEVDRPNGIVISPTGEAALRRRQRQQRSEQRRRRQRKLWRFDFRADGTVDPASQTCSSTGARARARRHVLGTRRQTLRDGGGCSSRTCPSRRRTNTPPRST